MKFAAFFILLITFHGTMADEKQTRLCGTSLDQAMQIICAETGLNTKTKKSANYLESSSLSETLDPMTALTGILLREEANMMAKIRRRRDGIVDECCKYKGCTMNELLAYCKPKNE
ncbi:probable insulin-like peptide 3 [Stomoxys calcitrans]|uniref:probable insulin-like peptide 3 n=1 Tax=Stomoxys calcitrans TaxID=35570 RepID=UPI0027E217A1|nr:probable insulin-like peptide 3 [Stomoxys calcitrans]